MMKVQKIPAAAAVLLLTPTAVLFLTQAIWLESLREPFPWMAAHPAATGLFCLLFSIPALLLWGLLRRPLAAYLPGTAAMVLLAYISRTKMTINGTPLQLSDLSLAGELGDIAGYASSQLIPSPAGLTALCLALLLLVLLARLGRALAPAPLTGFLAATAAMVLLLPALYPGPIHTAAAALDEPCRDQLDRCEQQGVCLGLYTAWVQRVQVASGAGFQDAEKLAAYFREDAAGARAPLSPDQAPDIIFITSESFFDVTTLPGLTFEEDPLPVFHALAETCPNGPFLTTAYGGGTGWVEMELFTCLTSACLKEGDTLSTLEEEVCRTLPTTVRLLEDLGYTTLALHSHNDELYRRDEIYPAIGFQEVLFIDDFLTEPVYKGPYVSDETFAREIIARYEARDPTAPCFLYGLSMENHQAYTAHKFDEPSGFPARSDPLTRADLAILDSLVMGLHDADAALGMLVDYFSEADRPVMLLFLGDHLPSVNLPGGETLYTRLGVSPTDHASDWDAATLAEILSTDYLIWTNYETEPRPDRAESCTFLGLTMLREAGLPLNAWFSWLDANVTPHMLLRHQRLFAEGDGTPWLTIPAHAQETADRYEALAQALVYGS